MFKREHFGNQDMPALLRELERLRAENKLLRNRRPQSQRYSQTVKNALADAHTIIMCAWSGEACGQVHMRKLHGLSRARWEWACALLRYAGIVKHSRYWRAGLVWLVADIALSTELLEKAATELDDFTGYQKLKAARLKMK